MCWGRGWDGSRERRGSGGAGGDIHVHGQFHFLLLHGDKPISVDCQGGLCELASCPSWIGLGLNNSSPAYYQTANGHMKMIFGQQQPSWNRDLEVKAVMTPTPVFAQILTPSDLPAPPKHIFLFPSVSFVFKKLSCQLGESMFFWTQTYFATNQPRS